MKRYFTQIRWIDPNGNGIISEYTFKAHTIEGGRKLAESKFWKEKSKIWGGTQGIEIRQIDSEKMVSGLINERTWKNPR